MASSLSSALSSMEVMLDALMQRGIGKPEDQKPKEEAPPALPTRPTVRGRLPSLQRPSTDAPWVQRPPMPSLLPPTQEEEEDKSLIILELERRATKAEEEVKQTDEEMRQKEDEIAALRQQVEHYESRLSECESRMKSVEDELQKQITSLQMAGARRGGSTTTSQHRQDLPSSQSSTRSRADETSTRRQSGRDYSTVVVVDEGQVAVNQLAMEFQKKREAFEHGVKSVDELKALKRQFGTWKKEYEARLRKTKAELKKLAHADKNQGHGHGHSHQRRCGWWRMKMPKCRAPKCCSFKLPSPKSCPFCCFRRCC